MNRTENSPEILDQFEDFLDDGPYWGDIDERVGEIHVEHHDAEDMDHCNSCTELFDLAEEAAL